MKEASAVVKDTKAALGLEVTDESLLESRNGYGPVRNMREVETGVKAIQILVEADLLAAGGGIVGELGWEVGIAEKGREFAEVVGSQADRSVMGTLTSRRTEASWGKPNARCLVLDKMESY